jgi:hypothetical protein
MAPHVIYDSRSNANTPGAGWLIIQDPTDHRNPNLVRFHRSNGQRKLLDQIAEWDPHSQDWRRTRWAPKPPAVPKWLLAKVENHMRNFQP